MTLQANDVIPSEILRHGAYVCVRETAPDLSDLAGRLGFENEFYARDGHPTRAIAFLRRIEATPGQMADDDLLRAKAIIHVGAPDWQPIAEFCEAFGAHAAVLQGVVRPRSYTGAAMQNFAYEHQVEQQPGVAMPNAFLIPLSKTREWWDKHWLERHTYFLPRYDDEGQMTAQGHALAAAAGIPCMLRRTYRSRNAPAEGVYDFVNYFECSDEDVPTFRAVCDALRDTRKNPEWKFVREGPTWHGRRVATWQEMFF